MLNQYLHRLYSTIASRGFVEIKRLDFNELPGHQGISVTAAIRKTLRIARNLV